MSSSIDFFRWMHILGIVFISLGVGLLVAYFRLMGNSQDRASDQRLPALRKLGFSLHGTGLLLIVITGFAMLGKKGYMSNFPNWAVVKLFLWLALGAITVIAKKTQKPNLIILILIVIAGSAAYIGVMPKI